MNPYLDRKYIAFISYRHLPLQMEVAKALHRRIERYIIPRGLRKNGRKKLGYVFRDQDELPIAGSLSDNIQYALDNSEFLIVICTPETSESIWCIREIEYFLEHHDRDHVLAVLADGAPAEAFPKEIVEVRDETGRVISQSEPLAANIVADSSRGRLRRLKSESLRILAALIGCPYDSLFRREQRYKYRRLVAASALVLCIAAAFVGMLLERNARIRDQLRASQVNESVALAALSRSAFRDGDYNGAVEYALGALPSEEDPRPYVADAEYALTQSLHLYDAGILAYDQSFEQPTPINNMVLTEDGGRVITTDSYKTVRCFDTYSGKLLWTKEVPSTSGLRYISDLDGVFLGRSLLRVSDGDPLWSSEGEYFLRLQFSRNEAYLIYTQGFYDDFSINIVETGSGEVVRSIDTIPDDPVDVDHLAVSDNGQYVAVLFENGVLAVLDTSTGGLVEIDEEVSVDIMTDLQMVFLDNGDLLVGSAGSLMENAFISFYSHSAGWEKRFCVPVDISQNFDYQNGSIALFEVDLLDATEECIAFGSGKTLLLLDRNTGETVMDTRLPSFICDVALYKNESFGLILSDASITLCINSGILSLNLGRSCFEGGYPLRIGAFSRGSYGKSVFALVPQSRSNRISVVRWVTDQPFVPAFENTSELSNAMVIPSPSGKMIAAAAYDYDTDELSAVFLDTAREKPVAECRMPVEMYLTSDMRRVFCTEDGKIISRGHVYDLVKHEEYDLTADLDVDRTNVDFDNFLSINDPEDGSVYSATVINKYDTVPVLYIWKDTQLVKTLPLPEEMIPPKTLTKYYCCGYGTSGCLIVGIKRYSSDTDGRNTGYLCCFPREDRWICLPDMVDDLAMSCAVGETAPLLACVNADKEICLEDLSDGSVKLIFPCDLPADSIQRMLFADEDRLLMVFPYRGNLQIYDTATGERLSDIDLNDGSFYFNKNGRYTVIPSADGRELLILYCDANFTRAVALERDGMGCTGFFSNIAHYLPEADRVVIRQLDSGLFYGPFYSLEDILSAGESVVSRAGPKGAE